MTLTGENDGDGLEKAYAGTGCGWGHFHGNGVLSSSPCPSLDVVVVSNDADDGEDDARRQQALPILLLPSGESPRTDDSFECESDRVLAMLPTPFVPATKVRLFHTPAHFS